MSEVLTELGRIINLIKPEIAQSSVTLEKFLVADLGVDSLAMIETIIGLEKAFGIKIPDQKVRDFKTVQQLVEFVAGLR